MAPTSVMRVENIVDEIRGAAARAYAGDKAAVLTHVVGDIVWAEDDRDVEVREEDDRNDVEQDVQRLARAIARKMAKMVCPSAVDRRS